MIHFIEIFCSRTIDYRNQGRAARPRYGAEINGANAAPPRGNRPRPKPRIAPRGGRSVDENPGRLVRFSITYERYNLVLITQSKGTLL